MKVRLAKSKGTSPLEQAHTHYTQFDDEQLSRDVSKNEEKLRYVFANCSDIVFQPIQLLNNGKLMMIYVGGMVDTKTLDIAVLQPLMFAERPNGLQIIERNLLPVAQVKSATTFGELVEGILAAGVVFLTDKENRALIANLTGFEKRTINEPVTENVVRGSRDAFTETLSVNTSLVRRRIRSPRLKMESITIGGISHTDVVIAYVEGIVSPMVLEEVRSRLRTISTDGIIESGYIEEFIEDKPFTPFPQIQNTERPDVVSASLLEGRVAIFTDNTPLVLIVPMTFFTGLQAPEDHYERFIFSTFVRLMRYMFIAISLVLPSVFVALTTFNPELMPSKLLISIAAAREGVPFPALIEVLVMEIMFEALREAGVRLPKPVGSAVSIVGALVIGDAAVQAGIISAPTVIVVATTGISSFVIPRYNLGTALRLIRFPLLLIAGVLGLYGIVLGISIVLIHLIKLRSFGVPYLSSISPQIPSDLKDVLVRAPRWNMTLRPMFISPHRRSNRDET